MSVSLKVCRDSDLITHSYSGINPTCGAMTTVLRSFVTPSLEPSESNRVRHISQLVNAGLQEPIFTLSGILRAIIKKSNYINLLLNKITLKIKIILKLILLPILLYCTIIYTLEDVYV